MSLKDKVRLQGIAGALALCALCARTSAQTITVGPLPLASGEVGVPYSQGLTATENPASSLGACCTWSARGLPGDLNLSFTAPHSTTAQNQRDAGLFGRGNAHFHHHCY
jgi:hypothetical protein